MTTQNISDSEIPPAKARRAPSSDNNFLCGPFDLAQGMLCVPSAVLRHALREIFRIFGCGFCRAVSLSRPLAFLIKLLDKTFPHQPVDD
jgi:hypothetical protein